MNLKLNIQARDNHGYFYDVEIQERNEEPVLRILRTPGGWYMSTLKNYQGSVLSIDFGAGWDCVNIQDVLAKARLVLAEVK